MWSLCLSKYLIVLYSHFHLGSTFRLLLGLSELPASLFFCLGAIVKYNKGDLNTSTSTLNSPCHHQDGDTVTNTWAVSAAWRRWTKGQPSSRKGWPEIPSRYSEWLAFWTTFNCRSLKPWKAKPQRNGHYRTYRNQKITLASQVL